MVWTVEAQRIGADRRESAVLPTWRAKRRSNGRRQFRGAMSSRMASGPMTLAHRATRVGVLK